MPVSPFGYICSGQCYFYSIEKPDASHLAAFYFYNLNIYPKLSITKTVYDPLGNAIVLSSDLSQLICIPNSDLCIEASFVITHAAMIFESTDDGSLEKYYLRTVEWDNFVLITAKKVGEYYITAQYAINPPRERILDLIKNCRQIK